MISKRPSAAERENMGRGRGGKRERGEEVEREQTNGGD